MRGYGLDSDHAAVQEAARRFAAAELAPQARLWDRENHFPAAVIRRAASAGYGGIVVGKTHGGVQRSRLEAALIFEALAAGSLSVAVYLSIHNMVAATIDRFGSDSQRDRFLPGLCSLAQFGAYCLTEPQTGSDVAALATSAARDGADYRLTGSKRFVSAGGQADLYIVMARTGGPGACGISAFLVPAGAAGLAFAPEERKMGLHAMPMTSAAFDYVRVPEENRLAREGAGFKIAMAGLDFGRLNIAACALGGAAAAIEKAVAWLACRRAFGRKLNQYQALRFRAADMATSLEAARSLLWRAATSLDARSPDTTKLCAMAKQVAARTACAIADEALQMHGGYGYLAETGIESILRDLRLLRILEGTDEIMQLIVARDLLGA